ncbi:hypothetical protein HED22_18340 [Thalassospira sp. HF15]|uniref:hypothetical protein n=1 Tax=Thalassospira sp. HF15 TaxID=2722755 RepID=UPI00143000FE|nr:hypothetical protein [Thalassospira sp. HF15]NIY77616.1 hypothetical protein [Thalassospira sp. HF15]
MITKLLKSLTVAGLFVSLAACQTNSKDQILSMDSSQVALRSVQSRVFDTSDQNLTTRTVIATLQDLGFTVEKADTELGLVSAVKVNDYLVKMTVTARQHGAGQTLVRASAQHNMQAISDPVPYQQFFDSLAQAMFLEAHEFN